MKHKLCTVRELRIYELCKVFIKALNREIGGTKQLYMDIFDEEEVRFSQSDKRRVHLTLSETFKENTNMIRNRLRRLTHEIVNLNRGIINNSLRLNFVTTKSFLHNFRDNYRYIRVKFRDTFCTFW